MVYFTSNIQRQWSKLASRMSNILILYFSIIIKKEIKLIYYSYVIIAIKNITQMYVKGDMSASLIKSFVIVFVLIEICMTIY